MTEKEPDYNLDHYRKHQDNPEDEISIFDILDVLHQKWVLIFLITIVSISLAAGYSFLITPAYKASIGFLPPYNLNKPASSSNDILWKIEGMITKVREQLYPKFVAELQSYDHQRGVFDSGNFLERFVDDAHVSGVPDSVARTIANSMSMKSGTMIRETGKLDKPTYLEMRGDKPEAMADFLNSLADTVKKSIKDEAIRLFIDQVNFLIKEKEKERKKTTKMEEIRVFTEQLALARKYNVKNHNFRQAAPGAPMWFVFGADLIEEKINKLTSKVGDDPQDPDVSSLRKVLEALESGSVVGQSKSGSHGTISSPSSSGLEAVISSLNTLEVAIIVQPGVPPTSPINKPSLVMTIFIGLIVGLVLGIIFAFASNAMSNLRSRKKDLTSPPVN